jgi:hypothetical protein
MTSSSLKWWSWLAIAALHISTCAEAGPPSRFQVFDGMHHRQKPNLVAQGLDPISIIYEGAIFRSAEPAARLSLARLEAALFAIPNDGRPVVLDIERWIWVPGRVPLYVEALRNARMMKPDARLGFYGVVPSRDYWRAIAAGSPAYGKWMEENDSLLEIAVEADYVFPSVYTFYNDPKGWVAYAEANIAEARRVANGKPVFVFLWPTFHESNRELRGQKLSGTFWRLQLDTARRLADGVVIWGGGEWREEDDWWAVTREFVAEIKKK